VAAVDLLAFAAKDLGVRTLLCEGGGELVAELFAARAVDEVFLTLVPRVLGGASATTMVGGAGLPVDFVPAARLCACEQVGDELFLRYEIAWPDAGG
jgi:5-amino-6-(5-phosphoribosylamino)uracil reductase